MTSLTLTHPTIWRRIEDFWKTMAPSRNRAIPPEDVREDSRAERDFILEMLDRNPDAFHSEMDIQSMARLCRCKF